MQAMTPKPAMLIIQHGWSRNSSLSSYRQPNPAKLVAQVASRLKPPQDLRGRAVRRELRVGVPSNSGIILSSRRAAKIFAAGCAVPLVVLFPRCAALR
mmetsp:Transcript_34390/g.47916  ORF Transcript_34390/g.47916 Transcript_34390/m.47916 type:complete len:98 (+) Transcript_34390:69-362(+)